MSRIDDAFAQQSQELRREYFVRALNWWFDNRKGQPQSLKVVEELAATLWYNDNLIKTDPRYNRQTGRIDK